ncbi:MAG TPA: nucleotide exchange factor GrpE [Euryarchaeota archaeon]|nr:heat shock protein GrpE [archaeon BMS3Bbin15]HDL15286.1 nucleotide exchange factor GrpE [Euryarchaeota archaeon]
MSCESEEDVNKRIEELERKLKDAESRAEDYLNQLKYMKADFENYRKRVLKEKEEEVRKGIEAFIVKLLDVLDNLERALLTARTTRKKKALVDGIEMVHIEFLNILKKEGLEEIEAMGKSFNHGEHECIAVEELDNCNDEEVIEVFQKGYRLDGRVIRYSKVKIAKKR